MKNYKILMVSLLLLIFMVGVVSAADENVTDDNLEITDEISVDEAVASDVEEEEVLTDAPSNAIVVVVDEEGCEDIEDPFISGYGVEKNYTLQLVDKQNNPYSNVDAVFSIYEFTTYDEYGQLDYDQYTINNHTMRTDAQGYGSLVLTNWAMGEYYIQGFTMGGTYYELWANINIVEKEPLPPFDGLDIYVDDTTYIKPQIKLLYGEEKYFTARFRDWDDNIYPNMNVTLNVINYQSEDPYSHPLEINLTTDENGVASFLIDFDIGVYGFSYCYIDGMQFNLQCNIVVYDPAIKGYMRFEVSDNSQIEGVIAYDQSISYVIWIFDQLENPMPNTLFYYTVNDVTYNATTTQRGNYILTIDSLPVGNYSIVVSYPEFDLSMNNTLYVLEKITTLHADNLTVVIGDGFEYAVKLTDKLGRPKANQPVTMFIGSQRFTAYSDENGIAIFDLDLDVGVYNNIMMRDSYNSQASPTIIVLANSSISADDNATFNCEGENSYSMSFTNIDGTPLVNGTVDVIIDDNENYHYVLTTDENGTISVDLSNLPGGNHTISIVNLATGEKTSTTVNLLKGKTSISAAAVTTVYNGGKYVIFTLKNDKGTVLAGKSVSVVLNGKTIKGTTDKNGQFKVSTDGLVPKAYSATMTFAGDDYLIGSTATAKITVNKATPKLTAKKATFKTKTKKYTITLKDNKNKAMKKVKVTLKVKGKTYKATTNAKGKATFKLTKLTKKGKYTAKVKFAGNKNFKAVTKSVKLTVKK